MASRSKGEVQVHAASLLARELSVSDKSEFHRIPLVMRENLFAAFDTLVDARILVYSKILRSHARSLVECSDASNDASTGLMAVEYKLKTLLEIGTNLSVDSFVTKFTLSSSTRADKADTEGANGDGYVMTIPIIMEAHIADLHVHSPFDGFGATIPLTFKAEGSITGTFAENGGLSHVAVDVDTDALLSSMITQAALVVGSVVDVTNEAWARTAALEEPDEDENDQAFIESDQTEDLDEGEPNRISPELGPSFAPAANKNIGHLNLIEDSCTDLVHAERLAKRPLEGVADLDEEDSIGSITDVSHLVDYAIGELDDTFIARPPSKKLCLPTL